VTTPPADKIDPLTRQTNLWFGCVRRDGRPHLTPVWFVWHRDKIYIGIDPDSVKSRSLRQNPHVVAALEDGTHPLICEGEARLLTSPYSDDLLAAFFSKYEWDITTEKQFHQVVEVIPRKWLSW
jgi:hypothetical protein